MKPVIVRSASFAEDAANAISMRIKESIGLRGRCVIGLSGGKTPLPVYSELAKMDVPWDKSLFTFSDERCVSPEHPDSNFRMAQEALFRKVTIPAEHVLRIRGEENPAAAALSYEKEIRLLFKSHRTIPQHDILLLGVGDDGHTASLFPGTDALLDKKRLVAENKVPKLDATRITFTYPLINSSRHVYFLVNDIRKEPIVAKILSGDQSFPASLARGQETLTWIIGY